ncbi:hypothetical protein ACFL20_07405 [Spirochaetota bacterium]
MHSEQKYEKTRLRDRFKELLTLSIFTILVTIVCIVVMDLLIYPITIFAVKQKPVFNFIIKNILIYILILLMVLMIIKKTYRLYKDGANKKEVIKTLIQTPIYYLGTFGIFLITSIIVIVILYLLLSNNYFFIYYFANS